jgi:phosphatidate phosphatase LPIN
MKFSSNFKNKTETIECDFYFWSDDSPVIISDIDGTITKSDVRGILFSTLGYTFYTHEGTASLFSNIYKNGYNIIYLTARSLKQVNSTREYIHKIEQNGVKLPPGPIITTPNKTINALLKEVVYKEPHLFKIAILKQISQCYTKNPYAGGFGNKETDDVFF